MEQVTDYSDVPFLAIRHALRSVILGTVGLILLAVVIHTGLGALDDMLTAPFPAGICHHVCAEFPR